MSEHEDGAGVMDFGVLAQLPPELSYLAAPAMKFGKYQFGEDVYRFLTTATPEQRDELARVAERVRANDHYPLVNAWLDTHWTDEHPTAANLYFLFGVMDELDLRFEP